MRTGLGLFCLYFLGGNVEKVVFIRKISKIGNRLTITIPKELWDKVEHGKYYRVTLELLEE